MFTVEVAPDGDDAATAGPFRSFAFALARLREHRGRRRLLVRGGTWGETRLELTGADSGLEIVGAEGERPRVLGGGRLSGWEVESDGCWSAPALGTRDGTRDFRSLIVNGRWAPRARWPEEGYLTHRSEFNQSWLSTTKGGWDRKPTREELTTMLVDPADVPADLTGAEITVHHQWDESLVAVASYDRQTGLVRFANCAGHPPGAFAGWNPKARGYVLWNLRQGLTRPGQWCLDRARERVVYRPLPDEALATIEAWAPVHRQVLLLAGTEAEPLAELTLAGLELGLSGSPCTAGGFAARELPAVIEANHLRDARFEDLLLCHGGGHGAKVSGAGVRLGRCEVRDCGAGGIAFGGTDIEISDCRLHHLGHANASAMGLRGGGRNHRVWHNELAHLPYSALGGGGHGWVIAHNKFHHAMEQLADGAAVYLFRGEACRIEGNLARDIGREGLPAHAWYLDEQSRDSLVLGNLSLRVPWPFHCHMATNCEYRRNVALSDGDLTISTHNCHGTRYVGNVVQAGGALHFIGSWTGYGHFARNVFGSASGKVTWDLHDRLPSLERNAAPVPLLPTHEDTVLADPGFQDPPDDLSYRPDSPAAALGLEPLELHAGPRTP